jgi:hypothetical protein
LETLVVFKPTNFRIVEAAISCHHKLNDMVETMLNITYFDGMQAARINMEKYHLECNLLSLSCCYAGRKS